ncbi:hypothetical protein [Streptomyces sp. NPDC012888]|uniref:hypothetical protein n=1 Tax=Streptomyces sp. NPDC012888 TaxID=3364855 RepID=UPI0036CFA239
MNVMKRTLAALVLSGGAAAVLVPAAHADDAPSGVTPVVDRVVGIADDPHQAVTDAKTAVGVATTAVGSSAKATDSSLSGAGDALDTGLPKTPSVG